MSIAACWPLDRGIPSTLLPSSSSPPRKITPAHPASPSNQIAPTSFRRCWTFCTPRKIRSPALSPPKRQPRCTAWPSTWTCRVFGRWWNRSTTSTWTWRISFPLWIVRSSTRHCRCCKSPSTRAWRTCWNCSQPSPSSSIRRSCGRSCRRIRGFTWRMMATKPPPTLTITPTSSTATATITATTEMQAAATMSTFPKKTMSLIESTTRTTTSAATMRERLWKPLTLSIPTMQHHFCEERTRGTPANL
mmetsp:Transcript_20577/g.58488  ORF Transcript_20577/g.58488 Transcript_20577/m.58488 type:complete len:247 (+) Transcript_20577:401-1141(+)